MKRKVFMICMILSVLLLLALAWNLSIGSMQISFREVLSVLAGNPHPHRDIITDIRLPRALLALTAGGILSLSGLCMQTLVRNPLADPYIMGITAGAGLGVNILLFGLIPVTLFSYFTLPVFAWIGAMMSLVLVLLLSYYTLQSDKEHFLMAGVATSAICTALTGFFIYRFAEQDKIHKLIFWTFGSFEKATPESIYITGFLSVFLIVFCWVFSGRMDLLLMGEVTAQSLGLSVKKWKTGIFLVVSCAIGGLVAFTGPIGFVGMIIPHVCRRFSGALHANRILPSYLTGAVYLVLCDSFTRVLLPPAGMPIGIITALLGVPFFIYLLKK